MFIINTLTNFNEPPRARHQVAYALAKKYPVVFVAANKVGFPFLKRKQLEKNLVIITPVFFFDYRIRVRIPFLNWIYQKWLFPKIKELYQDNIIINFDFTAEYLHEYFEKMIYYCNDDHVGMSFKINPKWIAKYHSKCENKVILSSKLCIGTSVFLTNKLKALNDNTHEIKLGAPDIKNININAKKHQSSFINAGFVGYLNTASIDIITKLSEYKDIFITIVGPYDKKVANKLKQFENIKLTGPLTGKYLFDEVNQFDVGIIPYNINSDIDRTPNKFWLYLAFGKPAVISNIPSIRDWLLPDKYLYKAYDNNEFYSLVKKAYYEDNRSLVEQRIKYASENTWDMRIKFFIKLCKDTFTENIELHAN